MGEKEKLQKPWGSEGAEIFESQGGGAGAPILLLVTRSCRVQDL